MLLRFLAKNLKWFLFGSSITKKIVFPARSSFPVKLICCIVFGSVSSACCLLKSIAMLQ